ncbi:MAG: mannitol dehydrogenase family protein [Cellulosilyticaceae bacterium]
MKLSNNYLSYKEEFESKGYELPNFDREKVKEETFNNPTWLHFGAGNIFRGFPAVVQQELLNKGKVNTGIIVSECYDYELIEKAYKPFDDLSILVVLKPDGSINKKVVGSVVESIVGDSENTANWHRLKDIFKKSSLQMVSFTITEKGYSLVNPAGEYYGDVAYDLETGRVAPKSFIGKLAALCYERYVVDKLPIALVSMDNCSHNGTKLYNAVRVYAKSWVENGLVEEGFIEYIDTPSLVSFPWSMIDKITPRPDESIKKALEEEGLENTETIITNKNTYTAPFVNAEEPQYLVIEDLFPNGRPALDAGGVIFTNRETVDKVEKMKVCTCLNPLHTTLAIYGCLLGYTSISGEMKDEHLKKLIEKVGYQEGLPVVVNPEIIKPEDFIKEVIEVRFPNPFVPDTPQRIATDTSQKLAIRFGETIKAYEERKDLDVTSLDYIPLVLAGWCRYLLAVDDNGIAFELSSDPLLTKVCAYLEGVKLGDRAPFTKNLQPILSDETIFGVNLYEVGLGKKVEGYFAEMTAGVGAIKETLNKYL